VRSQLPRGGAQWITELTSWDCRAYNTKLPHLVGGEAAQPVVAVEQLCCHLVKTVPLPDLLGKYGDEQPQTSIATCLLGEGTNDLPQASLLVRTLQRTFLHPMTQQTKENRT
jgi:hypothetical protein